MSVFHKINSHNNTGHFVIIAIILLVGFVSAVYFLKHPVVKSGIDKPIAISNEPTIPTSDNGKPTTSSESNPSQSSTNSNIPQTGLPVTGTGDGPLQAIPVFVLSFALSRYLLSNIKLRRYF